MVSPIGRDGVGRRLASLVHRTARWAWERDEVEQTVSGQKVLFSVVLYGSAFLLCLGVGGVLWLYGQQRWAITVWLVGNGLMGFFGTIAVGWDILELLDDRRAASDEEPRGPDRELAPDFHLSRDTKISFVVTVVLLFLISVGVLVVQALV